MLLTKGIALSLLGLASSAFAQIAKTCSSAKVCVAVNIPSSGSDTYFQISAPADAGWAGFGVGSEMRGALIFVIYPSTESGQVTVSPRIGRGNIMPQYQSSIKITMLPGSGIANGSMVANFFCSNCRSWENGSMDVKSTTHPFIWAIGGSGNAVKSAQQNANINKHVNKGEFTLDLVSATGGSGGDSVFSNSSSDSGSGSGSGNGSGNGNGSGSGSGSENLGGGGSTTGLAPRTKSEKILFAHGIATIVIALWFSFFA